MKEEKTAWKTGVTILIKTKFSIKFQFGKTLVLIKNVLFLNLLGYFQYAENKITLCISRVAKKLKNE